LLDECGTDWTRAAARGELPPMVGREAELRLLIEGLCRPTKPNVLLVGEAGVGKSALVEGLAARMAAGDVPAMLRDRPLIALSMAQVTRESRYYGVMEQRLAALLVEAKAVRAILFIDEGHAMTGAGGREGTGDVASVLKPSLARGDLAFITATTEQEYQRFILPNAALERRFTVVHLAEPGREAVRAMLAAHRDAIAASCGVMLDDAALDRLLEVTSVRSSHRREPDRSRDLLDQAVARAIAADAAAITAADIEVTAGAVSGVPEVTDASLAALEGALAEQGLLSVADAATIIDRLGTTYAGLALRPQRPRATLLVLRSGAVDGLAVADALATGVFGGPERVIAIDVGGISEPSAISGFLGTTQGYIGHGSHLPIHGLGERPHSVLLLGGVDTSHDQFRALLARAVRDGFLTDAGARRIGLSSAIVVLDAALPRRAGRRLGFRTGDGPTPSGPGADRWSLAAAAVGPELAAECDLVVIPPAGAADGRGWVAVLLGQLATSYRAAGIHLAWEPEVEVLLAADLRDATAREREAAVESRLGRAIRPLLGARPGRLRVRLRGGPGGLVADAEA
jgi:ATP-dependent Clp protease ATP-binding subunit ClpC